ncbi:MAG: MFS transporter [Rhodobacterales bacterium]|nr:MAG: MFS transporter [Rhodobacterales bacterium]
MTATARPEGLSAYIAVTAAYWGFMLTDGALRMLVLLHFHELGFSPVTLAWLFLLYEIAGIVTNLSAGWLAARFGLTTTLYAGLTLQIIALLALSQLDPNWAMALSVAFVMAVQGLSGVAKDLAKMSSKSAVKLLAPAGGGLFRWVAVLTGSKNAIKGLGFFLGAALLGLAGFETGILTMAAGLGAILVGVVLFMPSGLPKGSEAAKFSHVFATDPRVNRLSLARMFLFGARDTWFVVGVPIYFHQVLSDGTPEGARQAFFLVGGFMALWIIAYGAVQAWAPRLLNAGAYSMEEIAGLAIVWVGRLALIPAALALAALGSGVFGSGIWLTPVLAAGLMLFGFVFAVNSSVHSYLILAFAGTERVTMDVGFYYMSNAAGRLLGTLLSGISYQLGGLALCLGMAALMAGASFLAARRLV